MIYNKKILAFLILFFLVMPLVLAEHEILTVPYIIITIGIFASIAFFVISFIHKKNQLGVGPWILIAFAVFFLTLGEFFRVFVQSTLLHQALLTSSMILLFFTALFKYWDTIRLTQ